MAPSMSPMIDESGLKVEPVVVLLEVARNTSG